MEFAILLPVQIMLLFGIIDFGAVLFLHGNMLNAAREAARQLAVEDLTIAQTQAFADNYLAGWSLTFTINVTTPGTLPPPDDEDAIVQISVPLADASITGVTGVFTSGNLTATAVFRDEG